MIQESKFTYRITEEIEEQISSAKKFIFLRITKASSSVVMNNLYSETNKFPFVAGRFAGDNRSMGIVDPTLVFSIVRNPYERFVSGYNHILRRLRSARNGDEKLDSFCIYKDWNLEDEHPDPLAIWDMYKDMHPDLDHNFETFFKKPKCDYHNDIICPNQMNHLFSRQVDIINSSDVLPTLIIDTEKTTELVNLIRKRLHRISPAHRNIDRADRTNVHGYAISYVDFFKKFPDYKQFVEEHFRVDFETFGDIFGWEF